MKLTRGRFAGVLTQSLLSFDQLSPQPWIAVALNCDQGGEREKGAGFFPFLHLLIFI
jgi:hypothetical protein